MSTYSDELGACLAAIEQQESRVQAWASLDLAAAQDFARLPSGPLNGLIVGIKDIIDVADLPTGCGSARWKDSLARMDAPSVRRLRQAGAVILGKTVTTPFAYLDPAKTRNPWHKDRTPGGSSAGSAAAVACGMCTVAIGSQTGGSVIRPASYCGVASLKPTHGAISTEGVLPLAPSLDHIGIMAKSVRDLARVFQILAGNGSAQPYPIPDCHLAIDIPHQAPRLKLLRLAGLFEERAAPELLTRYSQALAKLESACTVIPRVLPPIGFHTIHQHQLTLMSAEAAAVHAQRFHRFREDYPPKISELIEMGLATKGVDLVGSREQQRLLRVEVGQMLAGSVFVTPATPDFAPGRETTGNPAFNSPWSFLGFPVVSVPAGWSDEGLPFALQFIGAPHSEADLLAVAAWAEQILAFERREVPS